MWLPGSSRAPKRELVRRTPLPTARTRPCRLVSRVMMRSASPSLWTRRTTASSRYNGTRSWCHRGRTIGRRRDGARTHSYTEREQPGEYRRPDHDEKCGSGTVRVGDPADERGPRAVSDAEAGADPRQAFGDRPRRHDLLDERERGDQGRRDAETEHERRDREHRYVDRREQHERQRPEHHRL